MGQRKPALRRPVKDRIQANVHVDPNGCWRWLGTKQPNGYGKIGVAHAVKDYVHRVAYQEWNGPIPDGLVVDHLCRVRDCCNPAHLEAVTPSVNTMRGDTIQVRRLAATQCERGHPWSAENTHCDSAGRRRCKTCRRSANRARYWANKVGESEAA